MSSDTAQASASGRNRLAIKMKGSAMSQLVLYMAMSLDGFITGPHDDAQSPAGINGMRLMDWLGGGGSGDEGGGVDGYRPSHPNS